MEFRDLKKQYEVLKPKMDVAIQEVLNSAHYISGPQVTQLENKLAEYVGVKHCISCANGTDALSLVLMAWGIKEGDAVFVPDFTFFATAEVVSYEGATPIFVDVDMETFNIDPTSLRNAIEAVLKEGKLSPKVIIPVDLFGLPANYPEIEKIAKEYNLLILEDGAQGFGGSINNQMACSFGDAATTSFFPAKPLGCYGDGGAIFTNDDELAQLLNSFKVHGKGSFKYDNVRIGVNSRLDTLQAAILDVKFEAFKDYELNDVNKVADAYRNALSEVVDCPIIPSGYFSSYAQFTIKLENEQQRDGLQNYLRENEIPTMIYYPKGMSQQSAYLGSKTYVDLSNTQDLCLRVLAIPIDPYVDQAKVDKVVSHIKQYLGNL